MKNLIFLILTLAVAAFALPSKEIRSRNLIIPAGKPKGRIAGGFDAHESQFPYQAGLIIEETNESFKLCGGSVLNNEWILTAAHCILNGKTVMVFLGGTDIESSEVKHIITNESFIIHEAFNGETYENDIALIRIPYTNYTDRIKSVKLPTIGQSNNLYLGENVIASGWGDTVVLPLNITSIKLQWVLLRIIPNECCNIYFCVSILSSQMCTSTIFDIDVGYGDSGGPLVLAADKTLIGVICSALIQCSPDYPRVYTRVVSFMEWIKKFTGI